MRNGCLFNHFKLFMENLELYRSLVSNALNVALYFFIFNMGVWTPKICEAWGCKESRIVFSWSSICIHIYPYLSSFYPYLSSVSVAEIVKIWNVSLAEMFIAVRWWHWNCTLLCIKQLEPQTRCFKVKNTLIPCKAVNFWCRRHF